MLGKEEGVLGKERGVLLPKWLALALRGLPKGLVLSLRSANEFHIEGDAALSLPGCCGDVCLYVLTAGAGPGEAIDVASDAEPEVSAAAAWAAVLVLLLSQSGVVWRRKGDEVRGTRCDGRVAGASVRGLRVRLSLDANMEGLLFIAGSIACPPIGLEGVLVLVLVLMLVLGPCYY